MGKGKKSLTKTEKFRLKERYIETFINYVDKYEKILIVNADNVRSKQIANIRAAVRNKAEILMGKNTMMRKALEILYENKDGKYDSMKEKAESVYRLLEHIKGNIGLVFTNEDLVEVRDTIREYKVAAPAKQGQISQVQVVVPASNTGLEPTKTSFFQALDIPTKITKGSVEITKDVVLLNPGDKVGNSEATLLNMMNILPFTYGLELTKIYDHGAIYSPSVLDLTDEMMEEKVKSAADQLASIGLELGIPNEASVPHSVVNNFKNLLAVSVGTEYTFDQAKDIKDFLADPSKFAVATAPAQGGGDENKEAEQEEEEEEEEDLGFGGLF